MDLTKKMYDKRWGVFNHFLYTKPVGVEKTACWNKRVEGLDVERIAKQLHEIGAGYYFITIMQGRKYMIAPNKTFDDIAGTKPGEACADRDLVLDLYDALSKYGIDLYLYFTGDGPYLNEPEGRRFGFVEPRENVTREFTEKWASVLEEYAVRYGEKVNGWWMDGCCDKFGYTNELLELYHRAIKKGNPNAIAAFNNGVKTEVRKWYKDEEFTAGEFNDFEYIPKTPFVDGARTHILAPLGNGHGQPWQNWRKPEARYDNAYMKNYIKRVHDIGAVVTVDIIVYDDGSFDKAQMDALRGV